MSPIKSRKHALPCLSTSRANPSASLTAALFTGLALGASLPLHAQAIGPTSDEDPQRKTTTLDKVEVQGELERQYSGELSSPKFTQPLAFEHRFRQRVVTAGETPRVDQFVIKDVVQHG